MKHTPAPWIISDIDPITGQDDMSIEYEGSCICLVRGTNDMSCIEEDEEPEIAKECLANARLIAAAPELLEALEKAMTALKEENQSSGKYSATLKIIESAIAKAKG